MKKKFWRWVFIIFTIVVIASIAITLVCLVPNDEDKELDTTPDQELYATSFSLNVPSAITILRNETVQLLDGYMSITPIEAKSLVTYTVKSKSGSNKNGITFVNNTITGKTIGEYEIEFSAKKSASTYYTRIVNINVVDDFEEHITQEQHSVLIGETKRIDEIFTINKNNYEITTDSKITYTENSLTAQAVGDSNITFKFTDGYLKYSYHFMITVKDLPEYRIEVVGIENNIININLDNNDSFQINYAIYNRNEQKVEQDIEVISSNENVVVKERILYPLIKINVLGKGEATLTIKLKNDPSIYIQLKVYIN